VLLLSPNAGGDGPGGGARPVGRPHEHLKVLSDKIDDVTTVDNILRSFVRPEMSDEEGGREHAHAQVITALPSTYTIETGDDPEMDSVVSEMPGSRRERSRRRPSRVQAPLAFRSARP
jgi:hypothetical protein